MAANRTGQQQDLLRSSLERLATGTRINTSADNASGDSVANSLHAQSVSARQAARNANDGISIVNVIESAADAFISTLDRMRVLAVQAASSHYSSIDRQSLNAEFRALTDEQLVQIAETTEFNGIQLGTTAATILEVQVGNYGELEDRVKIKLPSFLDAQAIVAIASLNSATEAGEALDLIDSARDAMAAGRAKLGAAHNSLESSLDTNIEYASNLDAAASRIEDTDFAAETAEMTKRQLISDASQSVLSQTQQMLEGVLKLL